MRFTSLIAAFGLCFASAAQAATINEIDVAGGFSSNFATPTAIAVDTTTVNGTLSGGDFDFLHFTSLAAGAQSIILNFNLADPNGLSGFQNAGGQVRVSETQPAFAFDGTRINPGAGGNDFELTYNPFNVGSSVVTQTLSYSLDNSFAGGDFYVSILTTFSTQNFSFGLIAPGNAVTPSPVPVPAAGLLLLGALGGFAALRRRKPTARVA